MTPDMKRAMRNSAAILCALAFPLLCAADYPDRPVLRVHTVSLEPDRAATPRVSNYSLSGGITLTRHPVAVDS